MLHLEDTDNLSEEMKRIRSFTLNFMGNKYRLIFSLEGNIISINNITIIGNFYQNN